MEWSVFSYKNNFRHQESVWFLKKNIFMFNFLRKKHGKIQKNSRSVGENTTLAAAAAWKFLKFSPSRRRRGCIYFLSAAAAQKFLKFSPSRRRRRLSRSAYTSNCESYGSYNTFWNIPVVSVWNFAFSI